MIRDVFVATTEISVGDGMAGHLGFEGFDAIFGCRSRGPRGNPQNKHFLTDLRKCQRGRPLSCVKS